MATTPTRVKCVVFHCDNLLSLRHRLDTCQACRNVFRYWEHPLRGVKAVIIRQHKLAKWQDRMGYLAEHKSPRRFGKVARHIPKAAAPNNVGKLR